MIRILILRTGRTAEEVLREFGDYDRWFTAAMDGLGCAFDTVDATRNPVPPLDDYEGVIVTGSSSSACTSEPWMEPLASFLATDAAGMRPVLAVCFGAQLLAAARGGLVVPNPEGWEIGRIEVDLTAAGRDDPLFEGMPRRISTLATHEDRIERIPSGATLLAANACSPIQAFRAGRSLWGVQFHPEATAPLIARLIRLRSDLLTRDARLHGRDPEGWVDRLLAGLEAPDPAHGRRLLENFVRLCGSATASA